ncbi:hypothetical protein [Caenispirillum bisanense]|uniref:hypothetical protein n=1 Tax=Caenispirillum bisanense TaxID=414052 RepID=UPI0031D17F3B
MIVKTIVQGRVAAGVIAAAGLAWAEVAPPSLPADPDAAPALTASARDHDRERERAPRLAGGGDTGYLPLVIGGRDRHGDDDDHHRRKHHESRERDHD